jgi:hypothetical protein
LRINIISAFPSARESGKKINSGKISIHFRFILRLIKSSIMMLQIMIMYNTQFNYE